MKKWHMIIDIEKCEDCNNCFLACKDEFVGNEWPGYSAPQPLHDHRWVNIHRKERGAFPFVDVAYLPIPCMHCKEAPCIEAGKGAVTRRPDGIVIIDPVKAKGNAELIASCPYNAIFWNEELALPQKCTFCAHLLDQGWEMPRCVHSCPTGALRVEHVEDEGMARIAAEESLEILYGELGSRPNVYYKNLYRFDKCFIAGSVDAIKNDVTECVEGARIVLSKDGAPVAETTTDNYGDFRFDGLAGDGSSYNLTVESAGREAKTLPVVVSDSVNMGNIRL